MQAPLPNIYGWCQLMVCLPTESEFEFGPHTFIGMMPAL